MKKNPLIIGLIGFIAGIIFTLAFGRLVPSGSMMNAQAEKDCRELASKCAPNDAPCFSLAWGLCNQR